LTRFTKVGFDHLPFFHFDASSTTNPSWRWWRVDVVRSGNGRPNAGLPRHQLQPPRQPCYW
jgi:hypothetical protein